MGPSNMPKRKRIRKLEWLVVSAILVAMVAILETTTAARYQTTWICARTGSLRFGTRWAIGGETAWRDERSALEDWMRAHDMKIVHDWQRIDRTGRSLILERWVSSTSFGDMPPIIGLERELLTRFVHIATDEHIREFVETFQGNDLGAQKRAIGAIERHPY